MVHNAKRKTLYSIAVLTLLASTTGCKLYDFNHEGDKNKAATTTSGEVSLVTNNLGLSFPQGMDENENPYLDYIEKSTGLNLKVTLPPSEVYQVKLDVIMASDNVPDLINSLNDVWVGTYVKQGQLLPLDDLIEKYGPDLKAHIPKEAWNRVRYDGKIYAIPSMNEIKGIEIMYGRKDWLDKLGLSTPTTVDEYFNVIKAFTWNDPDGNGVHDTYGLILSENLGRTSPFFGAFGTQLDTWLEKDGRLVNGSVLPETKEAVAYLAKLYTLGLIDSEFPLNRANSLGDKVRTGKVGLYSAAWYDTRGPIEANKKLDPKAEWIPLPYPVGPRGQKGVASSDPVRTYNVIPAKAQNPVGVIKLLNFIAGEGHKTLKLGFENHVWKMENGKIVTKFDEHNKDLYRGIYQSMLDYYEPDELQSRLESLGSSFHLFDNLRTVENNLYPNQFRGTTPSMSNSINKLNALKDRLIRIIVGVEPIEAFDEYVKEWNQDGGAEITKEVNDWYRKEKKP